MLAATALWELAEALRGGDDAPRAWHGWLLLVSGAALSLDDFAVGLALGALAVPVAAAVITFGLVSAVLTLLGLELGAKLGLVTGKRGELVAAILLLGVAGAMAANWL